jgi:calcium-binding protein CML
VLKRQKKVQLKREVREKERVERVEREQARALGLLRGGEQSAEQSAEQRAEQSAAEQAERFEFLERMKMADMVLFHKIDADGNGTLDAGEVQEAMTTMFGIAITRGQVREMMKEADDDGDGEIDLEEFTILMAEAREAGENPNAVPGQVQVQVQVQV